MNPRDESILRAWFIENQWEVSAEQVAHYLKHMTLIKEASTRMNLISKNDLPQLVERHIIDSLGGLMKHKISIGAKVADLGSGAGFPGVPIAIARPDLRITLIESRRLKSLFLHKVVDELNLENVLVVHGRWEEQAEKFDVILARAVYNEAELNRVARPRLLDGGVILYYAKVGQIKIIRKE